MRIEFCSLYIMAVIFTNHPYLSSLDFTPLVICLLIEHSKQLVFIPLVSYFSASFMFSWALAKTNIVPVLSKQCKIHCLKSPSVTFLSFGNGLFLENSQFHQEFYTWRLIEAVLSNVWEKNGHTTSLIGHLL